MEQEKKQNKKQKNIWNNIKMTKINSDIKYITKAKENRGTSEVNLIDVRTGKKIKRFLTKRQFENLPIHLCLPYEYEDRKKLLKETNIKKK